MDDDLNHRFEEAKDNLGPEDLDSLRGGLHEILAEYEEEVSQLLSLNAKMIMADDWNVEAALTHAFLVGIYIDRDRAERQALQSRFPTLPGLLDAGNDA